MGHRANLVIVENDQYELYYDHWCANNIEQNIFWGESRTVEFIRSHDIVNNESWLDNVWGEGGILIDLDNKVLLFFGGESILGTNVHIHTIFFNLLSLNWPSYDIRWAWRKIADLADYVGYQDETIISPIKEISISNNPYYDLDIIPDSCYGIISYIKEHNLLLYPSSHFSVGDILQYGDQLIDLLDKITAHTTYSMQENELSWGIHLNEATKEIFYWALDDLGTYVRLFDQNWPNFNGWKIHWLGHDYQWHIDLLGENFIDHIDTLENMINSIKNAVCFTQSDPIESMQRTTQALKNAGYEIEINNSTFIAKAFNTSQIGISDKDKFDSLVKHYSIYSRDQLWSTILRS